MTSSLVSADQELLLPNERKTVYYYSRKTSRNVHVYSDPERKNCIFFLDYLPDQYVWRYSVRLGGQRGQQIYQTEASVGSKTIKITGRSELESVQLSTRPLFGPKVCH